MKNKGKVFEESIRNSINKEQHLLIRLNDQPQSFANTAKFSLKNPFDYLLFDTNSRTLYCFELKSTKYKSMSFEDINNDEEANKMIHRHQILGLKKYSEYQNVKAGFLFNFRHFEDDKEKYFETTYYQSIEDFLEMIQKINKKSFDEINLLQNKSVKLNGLKKRSRWYWDIDVFLQSQSQI